MHPIPLAKRLLLGGLAASVVVATTGRASAQAQQPPMPPPAAVADAKFNKSGALELPLGATVQVKPKQANFTDTVSSNPDVAEVRVKPDDPSVILINGKLTGVARITVAFPGGKSQLIEVIVQPDYELLRRVIQRAVPTASVDVIPGVGSSIILTGYVNKPEDTDVVLRIAQSAAGGAGAAGGATGGGIINAIQIGGVQHVQIEVVIAQVDRTELRSRGADFVVNGRSANFSSLISGLIATTNGANTISPEANLQVGIAPAGIFTALRALHAEGVAKFLSEPKVVTQTGRPAVIRSGGRQAVLGVNGGIGGISVNLENIGTTLEVLPIVYGNGKIYLEVSPSVITPNAGFGIQTASGFSTGFAEQSVNASVMLESGQTFAIGGLLETSSSTTKSSVPILGDLPFVGTAFSRITSDERERELIILVTPRLVDAMDCAQLPKRVPGRETRSPDDYELFLEGLLEAPRGQRQVWNGRCYNAAWKCANNGYPCKGDVCTGSNGTCAAGTCNGSNCGSTVPAGWAKAVVTPVGPPMLPTAPVTAMLPTMGVVTAEATAPPPPPEIVIPPESVTLPVAPVIPLVPVPEPPAGGKQ